MKTFTEREVIIYKGTSGTVHMDAQMKCLKARNHTV